MDKLHTWGPPIWQTTLSDSIIKDLLEQGDAVRNHEQFNAENDLAMNTHDEWNYTPDFIKWFSQAIRGKLVDYMQIWAKHQGQKYNKWLSYWYIDNLWVNYMQQYDCNPLHDHKGTISFIIYLNDVPELLTEKQRLNLTNNGPTPGSVMFTHNDERKLFFPNKGEFFLFPSSTMHMVVPYKSDVTRISVSGNIIFPTNCQPLYLSLIHI